MNLNNLTRSILLLAILTCATIAQVRQTDERRAFRLPPVLFEDANTHLASGLAQDAGGLPVLLFDSFYRPIRRGALVSLYGMQMKEGMQVSVIIQVGLISWEVEADVWKNSFPKIQSVAFRLPVEVTGEVGVTVRHRYQFSNSVRFYVE